MGKGDKKTRRGKIVNGSSGKRRQKKNKSSKVQPKKVVAKVKPEAKPKPARAAGGVETKETKVSKPKASPKKPAAPKAKKETKE